MTILHLSFQVSSFLLFIMSNSFMLFKSRFFIEHVTTLVAGKFKFPYEQFVYDV